MDCGPVKLVAPALLQIDGNKQNMPLLKMPEELLDNSSQMETSLLRLTTQGTTQLGPVSRTTDKYANRWWRHVTSLQRKKHLWSNTHLATVHIQRKPDCCSDLIPPCKSAISRAGLIDRSILNAAFV
jgi:hypothetical protein